MKRALLLAALIAVAAAAASVSASHAASTSLPTCPSRAPKFVGTLGTSNPFVRPRANALRMCRYYKNNWATGMTLWRQRLITQSSTITSLTGAFNRLQEPPRGIFCVKDDGSEMQLIFGYANGTVERVTVKLSGCRFASNGKAVRSTTAYLHDRLIKLVMG